ncbi:hypothetical protein M422DRAFT_200979 [Sphaerobolus stellatus SS14]|nr:hypothetical protein M422DRAFT_200979 [Sphaerobolus stellatus SS14]
MFMASTTIPQTTIFFQDKCLLHRYVRSQDKSLVFERPERLRAVKSGVAAAIARLEERQQAKSNSNKESSTATDGGLAEALEKLNITEEPVLTQDLIGIVMSTASVDLLHNKVVNYVHGDIDGEVYLENLVKWAKESEEKIAQGETEIPEGLPQGDLYLCAQSLEAIQGAIGTVCEAVDSVVAAAGSSLPCTKRAFAAIRPPGHHCGEDTPSGFCFVNNVVIGAAHAHLVHDISRVVILDIDLHHGNGTQSLAWQINEDAFRETLEAEASGILKKKPLRIYYGSLHDPLSYPCEDGNPALVQAASISIHGPHEQHIENIHLVPYTSEEDFWDRLYPGQYSRLLQTAEAFLAKDNGEALIFISAGFDGSEHETASMSRHGRKLPTGFYARFARDVRTLAEKYTKGRIVSVLEGGYSDRALCSGTMSHILGLAEEYEEPVDPTWWSEENLIQIEKVLKKRRGGRVSEAPPEGWIDRTVTLLACFDPTYIPPSTTKSITPSTRVLRSRDKESTPSSSRVDINIEDDQTVPFGLHAETEMGSKAPPTSSTSNGKKLPRVILKVNPPSQGIPVLPPKE